MGNPATHAARDTRVPTTPYSPTMTTSALAKPITNATWINLVILVGSGLFVFGLIVSAVFAPEWRVLHVFQALIYVAVVVLTRRQSPWGFGAGVIIASFWNSIALATSTIVQDGIHELEAVARTAQLQRPDALLQLFAFFGHVLIIVACLAGFLRTRPGARQWGQFAAGGVLAIVYLVAMVFAVGPPQGVALMRRVFGL